MRGVAPHDQDDEDLLFALVILIGSAFASAFAASYAGDRNISAQVLPALPIPTDVGTIREIAAYGREAASNPEAAKLSDTLVRAEETVWSAYGVNETDRQLAVARFVDEPAPEGKPRYEKTEPPAARGQSSSRRIGTVLDVDGTYLRLWVNGVTPSDGVTLPMPTHMPGWMARRGATFDVRGVSEIGDLAAGDYTFQPMAWQDIDFDSDLPEPLVLD